MEVQLQFSAYGSSPFHIYSVFATLLFELLNLEDYTEQEIESYFGSSPITLMSDGVCCTLHLEDKDELEEWKTVASVVTKCIREARSRSGLSADNSVMPVDNFDDMQILVNELRSALSEVENNRHLIDVFIEGLFAFCSYFPW